MKKKTILSFVLILVAITAISLIGCADMRRPNNVTREQVIDAADYLELDYEEFLIPLRIYLAEYTYLDFFEYETIADATTRFRSIDNSYNVRRSSISTDIGTYRMRRFTSQGTFVRLYQIDYVVIYARGPSDKRSYIDTFMERIIIRD
ncbi:MAG: hypothetical protein FWE13_02595 [Firmicutes bacterium]|nr:hypothetical protein [Bacillota bacterium]